MCASRRTSPARDVDAVADRLRSKPTATARVLPGVVRVRLARALEGYYADRDACARDGRRGREYLEAHFGRARALREYYELIASEQ